MCYYKIGDIIKAKEDFNLANEAAEGKSATAVKMMKEIKAKEDLNL